MGDRVAIFFFFFFFFVGGRGIGYLLVFWGSLSKQTFFYCKIVRIGVRTLC